MSRSGYSDDIDNWDLIKWRGQVASAIRGKRGQLFLRELLAALDALPNAHQLVQEIEFINDDDFCYDETPEKRFTRVRAWVVESIKDAPP